MNEYLVPCKKVLLLTKLTSMCKFRLVFVRYYRYRYLVPVQIATNCCPRKQRKNVHSVPPPKNLYQFFVLEVLRVTSVTTNNIISDQRLSHTNFISFQITPGSDHITSALLLH